MLSASYPVRSDSTDPGANDDVRLSANDVKLMGQVGCGGFATSFLAELQRDIRKVRKGTRVCVKILKEGTTVDMASNEVDLMRQMLRLGSHNNVVKLLGSNLATRPYFIVMEFVEGWSLFEEIKRGGALPLPKIKAYGEMIVLGLNHLHASSLMHCDLKSSNVMIHNPTTPSTGKQQEEEARSIRSNQRARRHTERQPELIAKVIQPSLDEETSSPAPPHCPRPVASGTAVAREPEAQPGAESEDAHLPRRRAARCAAQTPLASWRTGQFGTAKLVDFGEGRSVNSAGPLYRQLGTWSCMAPEVMQLGVGVGLEVETPHAYGPPADVYSLGSLLYEMAAGHVPYKGQAPPQIAFNVARGKRPTFANVNCPELLEFAIRTCWQTEPSARPSLGVLLALLKSVDPEQVMDNVPEEASVWKSLNPKRNVSTPAQEFMAAMTLRQYQNLQFSQENGSSSPPIPYPIEANTTILEANALRPPQSRASWLGKAAYKIKRISLKKTIKDCEESIKSALSRQRSQSLNSSPLRKGNVMVPSTKHSAGGIPQPKYHSTHG
eukprot:CAMPEP_0114247890 /NCGR_PEP_ID=MMETSP0058-20121206/13269_1 /TAXON_ID=36894 /ORGANISM="Pyramimonas parkeae, CCMP726" /LENGTH=550 /DNA_ID=CAMNT_0001361237 /DNA_START=328 /DNA_END=1981 /DNA_ORIENTATION=-